MQTVINLDSDTEAAIRALYPCTLNQRDMEFAAAWFMMVGLSTAKAALRLHPHLSIGDLMSLSFRGYNA